MTVDADAPPLGVRPEVMLTAAQHRALQVLQDFDLSPVRERLLSDAVMPSGWVDEAILEFRRYLGLRVVEEHAHYYMFSKPVDNVWHTCLLFSRLYAQYCQEAFGHFVHHEPAAGHDPADSAAPALARETRWRAFETAYVRTYGELPRLWQMARPVPD
jgi:hypothetical protein